MHVFLLLLSWGGVENPLKVNCALLMTPTGGRRARRGEWETCGKATAGVSLRLVRLRHQVSDESQFPQFTFLLRISEWKNPAIIMRQGKVGGVGAEGGY